MPSMTKRVNVVTRVAVRNVNPPISGSYKNIVMSTSDILKLLSKRAIVEEILPDGSTVKLTMKNYYLDNGAGLDAYANVNMDDKYNTDKDSKKNRGPLVHKAKPAIPPTSTVKPTPVVVEPITEPAPIEDEQVKKETAEVTNEEKEVVSSEEETFFESVKTEELEAPITLEEHKDTEEIEASLELTSVEEESEEEEEEEEEPQTTSTPSNNNSNNNNQHKKKKKKR